MSGGYVRERVAGEENAAGEGTSSEGEDHILSFASTSAALQGNNAHSHAYRDMRAQTNNVEQQYLPVPLNTMMGMLLSAAFFTVSSVVGPPPSTI